MLKVLLVLGLSHTAAAVDDQPYCALRYRRLCQGKGRHVACQFPDPGPGISCQNYTQIKFTSDLKHFVVHYINKRRQRIAAGNERVRGGVHLPRPEIMMLVGWDRELATLAQRLADQCHFVHDDCRATLRYPYAGQSVGEVRWRGGGEGEAAGLGEVGAVGAVGALRRVLDAWWGERRRVHARQLVAPFRLTHKDMVWGHFSQLAVWNLRAVGCGAVRHGFEHTRMLLVCDFSHTNMLGQRTITPGSLAPCPIHTARRPRTAYPLLCAPVKRPTLPEKDEQESTRDYGDGYDEENGEDDEKEEERTTKPSLGTTRKHRDRTIQKFFRSDFTMTRKGRDRDRRIEMEKGSSSFGYQQAMSKNKKTTLRAIDEFEQEVEMNSNKQVTLRKYQQWETRRPGFGRSWENSEITHEDHVIFSNAKKKPILQNDEDASPDEHRKLIASPDINSNHGLHTRHRWKQSRMRPQRPGANALLNKAPEKYLRRSSISMISFVLDKDDSDQLFRDTGFNVNWRKRIQ